jgi:hypothetical protein
MVDLLLLAFEGKTSLLAPLGWRAGVPSCAYEGRMVEWRNAAFAPTILRVDRRRGLIAHGYKGAFLAMRTDDRARAARSRARKGQGS